MTDPIILVPFHPTTLSPHSGVNINVQPFTEDGFLLGIKFDPACAAHIELDDLRAGQETLFECAGRIPGKLLIDEKQQFVRSEFRLGNSLSAFVWSISSVYIVVRGAFLVTRPDQELERERGRFKEMQQGYLTQIHELNQTIASLNVELSKRMGYPKK